MADTVKLPVVGSVKKQYLWIGGALVAGIAGYAYYRSTVNAAAEAQSTDTVDYGATDTTSADTYGTDYGAYDYAYAGSTPDYMNPSVYPDYYDYTDSYGDSSTYLQPPATDQQWAQQAISFLESTGVEAGTASSAVGTYMGGLCLTSDQADLIRRALATAGDPPQSNRTVYICPSSGSGGTTNPPPSNEGSSSKPSRKNLTGLHMTSRGRNHVVLDWDPVPGASGYTMWVSGKRWASYQYSTGSAYGLKPNSRHKITVCWNYKNTCMGHQSIYVRTSK